MEITLEKTKELREREGLQTISENNMADKQKNLWNQAPCRCQGRANRASGRACAEYAHPQAGTVGMVSWNCRQ